MSDDSNSEFTLEVVELENEEGVSEEYVVLDRVNANDREYVLLALLSEIEALEDEEDEDAIRDQMEDMFVVMRVSGEEYVQIAEDELESVRAAIEAMLSDEDE